jgi:AcrR family transcriptional regulator
MRADSKETVDELLDLAERLFAKHGVEQVPLTRIVASSSQKNRSALHYHFGSREGMLAAVLNRRLERINALRQEMLEGVSKDSRLPEAIRAFVGPLCFVVLNEPWGPDYISILAQVSFHPRLLGERTVDDANISALRRCKRLIEQALPDVPRKILSHRFKWFTDSAILAIARWTREVPKSLWTHSNMEELGDGLIAYGLAGLSAPAASADRAGNRLPLRTGR